MTKVAFVTILILFIVGLGYCSLESGKTEWVISDAVSLKDDTNKNKDVDLRIEPGISASAINVRFVDNVVMAKSNLKKGQKFHLDSVIEIDIETIDDPPTELKNLVRSSSNVLGHKAARKIRKGSLIRLSDISLTD